jgi:hypothetical protein
LRYFIHKKKTSAASERAFSAGKYVFGLVRMSLRPKTVEALTCLRSWYKAGLLGEKNIVQFLAENFDPSQLQKENDNEMDD